MVARAARTRRRRPRRPPGPRPSAAAPGSDAVTVVDFDFRPGTIDVVAGATVVWSNDGAAPHTVTAEDGSWDSGMVAAVDTFQRRFTAAGTYAYLCAFHPDMTGTVRVAGAGGGGADPPRRRRIQRAARSRGTRVPIAIRLGNTWSASPSSSRWRRGG